MKSKSTTNAWNPNGCRAKMNYRSLKSRADASGVALSQPNIQWVSDIQDEEHLPKSQAKGWRWVMAGHITPTWWRLARHRPIESAKNWLWHWDWLNLESDLSSMNWLVRERTMTNTHVMKAASQATAKVHASTQGLNAWQKLWLICTIVLIETSLGQAEALRLSQTGWRSKSGKEDRQSTKLQSNQVRHSTNFIGLTRNWKRQDTKKPKAESISRENPKAARSTKPAQHKPHWT